MARPWLWMSIAAALIAAAGNIAGLAGIGGVYAQETPAFVNQAIAQVALLYVWIGLAAHGWDRILALAGGLVILGALVVARRSVPAAVVLLAVGALPVAITTFIVDSSKITDRLGVHATPLDQAIADTLASYRTP